MKICNDLLINDVPASGQLKESESVSFCLREHADIKLLFLGNSITRHGKAESLGWLGDWGMAASGAEKDYVHTLVRLLEEDGKCVSYCVANLSEWERTRDMLLLSSQYAAAKAFGADIVIVRLGENAGLTENLSAFLPCYRDMTAYFTADGARAVITDLFWEYEPFDSFVQSFAKEQGFAFARLHDLGNAEEMKATGIFFHQGVAAHPGDKGMAEIAKRIYCALTSILN